MAASDQLDGVQEWLLHLVQQPQEDALARLGLPTEAGEVAGGIGADIVIAPVNRAVEGLTKIVDIVGIVGGAALGLHPIALLCFKHLVHTEFHDMVVKAVTRTFDGLVADTKQVPAPSQGDPARRPSPAAQLHPAAPAKGPVPPLPPDEPEVWPASPPKRPPPPPPAPGTPPPAPPSPRPWRPGGPRIAGPGGF